MIYEEAFKAFQRDGVRYLVVGGVATNIYGYVRMTVDLSEENLSRIVSILERQGYLPRAPIEPGELLSREKRGEWIAKKGAVVFTFVDPRSRLDR